MSDQSFTLASGFDWESAEDFTELPERELWELLARVVDEERVVAYRHEILRGRANLIRAELAGRGVSALSSEGLARVLLGEVGEEWST